MVRTTAPAPNVRPSDRRTPPTRSSPKKIVDLAFDDRQICRLPDRLLHRGGIELPVGLRARTAHRGPFAAVQNPELDAGGISNPAHQTVERIDFADQMALTETADRRIA